MWTRKEQNWPARYSKVCTEVVGHLEHERPGLLGLPHDLGDGEGVVAVPPDDGLALGHAGRRTRRWMGAALMELIVAFYENLILTGQPAGPPAHARSPPVVPFATVRNLALGGNSIAPER